jgi:prevent-host-death family protein
MKEATITISEFKAKCLGLIEGVAGGGESIIITKHGKAVAKVIPILASRKSTKGSWKGLVEIRGDIVHFDASEDWEAIR